MPVTIFPISTTCRHHPTPGEQVLLLIEDAIYLGPLIVELAHVCRRKCIHHLASSLERLQIPALGDLPLSPALSHSAIRQSDRAARTTHHPLPQITKPVLVSTGVLGSYRDPKSTCQTTPTPKITSNMLSASGTYASNCCPDHTN